jgi:hypothetical protein
VDWGLHFEVLPSTSRLSLYLSLAGELSPRNNETVHQVIREPVSNAFDEGSELLSAARWQRHVTFCPKLLAPCRITQCSFNKIREIVG